MKTKILNKIKHLSTRLRYKQYLYFKSSGKFCVHRNAKVKLDKKSSISIQGKLVFNHRWVSNDPFSSLLVIGPEASLIVNGYFRIYSGSRVYINKGAELSLGSGYINSNLNLSCFDQISIGNDVAISENVSIRDSDNHVIDANYNGTTKPINIGNRVWVGMNVTILKGVTIGDGSIIAAGSVVTKDVPANSLAAGVPARVVRSGVTWT